VDDVLLALKESLRKPLHLELVPPSIHTLLPPLRPTSLQQDPQRARKLELEFRELLVCRDKPRGQLELNSPYTIHTPAGRPLQPKPLPLPAAMAAPTIPASL